MQLYLTFYMTCMLNCSQEIWCFPGLRQSYQTDSTYPGSWSKQGWQVSHSSDAQWQHGAESWGSALHNQVSNEEGTMFTRNKAQCSWQLHVHRKYDDFISIETGNKYCFLKDTGCFLPIVAFCTNVLLHGYSSRSKSQGQFSVVFFIPEDIHVWQEHYTSFVHNF